MEAQSLAMDRNDRMLIKAIILLAVLFGMVLAMLLAQVEFHPRPVDEPPVVHSVWA